MRLSTAQRPAGARKRAEPTVDTPEEAEALMLAMLGIPGGGSR